MAKSRFLDKFKEEVREEAGPEGISEDIGKGGGKGGGKGSGSGRPKHSGPPLEDSGGWCLHENKTVTTIKNRATGNKTIRINGTEVTQR